jgi:hypothetical protein
VTLFSARYCGEFDNAGAMMSVGSHVFFPDPESQRKETTLLVPGEFNRDGPGTPQETILPDRS